VNDLYRPNYETLSLYLGNLMEMGCGEKPVICSIFTDPNSDHEAYISDLADNLIAIQTYRQNQKGDSPAASGFLLVIPPSDAITVCQLKEKIDDNIISIGKKPVFCDAELVHSDEPTKEMLEDDNQWYADFFHCEELTELEAIQEYLDEGISQLNFMTFFSEQMS